MRYDQESLKRLKILVQTNDGFKIAEEDLKMRGPGELFGREPVWILWFLGSKPPEGKG